MKVRLCLFTFHYVYIYIAPHQLFVALIPKFTFHYVYIYIFSMFHNSCKYQHLHSTMFIFIFGSLGNFIVSGINLHSTMFIFIWRFCFYRRHLLVHLHSTMFIFILTLLIFMCCDYATFTFNYVYIYIVIT